MNTLDEIFGPEVTPVNIDEITAVDIPPLAVPAGTIKNRAAVATMLNGNGERAAEDYQSMVAEGESGSFNQANQMQTQYHDARGVTDNKAVMSILSDSSLTIDQKRAAIAAHGKNIKATDSRVHLMTKNLEEASPGETIENEDARISTAYMLQEMHDASEVQQGLVNAHGASLADMSTQGARVTVDAAETLLAPFGQSITSFKYAKAMAEKEGRKFSIWDGMKSIFDAGGVKADMVKKLESLPPQGRNAYVKNLLGIISENSSIIVPTDNQFNQMIQANDILGEDGYSNTARFLDSASVLLDIIGFGALRNSTKVVKAAAEVEGSVRHALPAEKLTPTAGLPERVGPNTPASPSLAPSSGFEAKVAPTPMQGTNDALIAAKQAEVSDLLGEAGNLAEKGAPSRIRAQGEALAVPDVSLAAVKARAKDLQKSDKLSYKEAYGKASKEMEDASAEYQAKSERMNNMLDSNANASNASQRIDALEKEIASLQKSNAPMPAKKTPLAEAISRIEQNSVVRRDNPASVAAMAHQTNPSKARSIHAAVVNSTDDSIAEAMYGTSRTQAIINDTMPQVLSASGAATAKVGDIGRGLMNKVPNVADLRNLIRNSDVGIHMGLDELKAARAHVVNNFGEATDLVPIDAMGGFATKLDGSTLEISSTYGTRNGAFSRAQDAIDQTLMALRKEGVTEDEVTLLKKQGLDYVPTNLAQEAGKEGSYLVRLKMNRELSASDIGGEGWQHLDVKRNVTDRMSSTVSKDAGTLNSWLFDASSNLDELITGGAVVGTDVTSRFEKVMLDLASQFSNGFVKLSKERKAEVQLYIKEANFTELAFDRASLIGRFDDNELDILQNWRNFWDTHHFLENLDVVRTYNNQGYMLLKNPAGDELAGKPMAKQHGLPDKVYDPSAGQVGPLARQDFDDLYSSGGTVARLRRPITIGNQTTEYMVVRNTPTEYLRRFRDSDTVLNYKEGYYQINYTAPRFVDEVHYKPNGDVDYRKAVAVGASTKEVETFATRMRAQKNGFGYETRGNERGMVRGSDDWYDVESSAGRIAQKHRGKVLEDSTGINHLGDGSHILNPTDSAVRAARSISGRTVMRPMLETARERFLSQYAEVLKSDGMGGRKFPSIPGDIGKVGKHDSKMVSDARTTWNYIHYLENGYMNSLDNLVKQGFNTIATLLGERGFDRLERIALKAGDTEGGVTNMAKGTVFASYIALNPLRNWIVQTHQAVRTFSYNPVGWMTGGIPTLLGEYTGIATGAIKNPSAKGLAFKRLLDESGLFDSVDKQNLVRGSLQDAVQGSQGPFKWGRKAIEVSRKVGFDAGETMNLLAHAAAVFDKRIRDGKGFQSLSDMREMHSETRAISYDMNFAGDMTYNQTSAAMILQFMQVPHKAFLQATNRRIAPAVRTRMLLTDMVVFGAPVALISQVMGGDILTDDKDVNDWFIDGVTATMWNKMWTMYSGEEQHVDYSSLSPLALDGWAKIFTTMFTDGGVIPALMNSPAGQVFLKDGGRVQSALASLGRFFNPFREEDRTPEEFKATVNEVAKIASGWNNVTKARLMFATSKALDKGGVLLDDSVTNHEAFMQIFGFSTQTVKQVYETQMWASRTTKERNDEIKHVYKEIKQYYQSQLDLGITDPKQMQAVTGEILSMYKDDPGALAMFYKEIEKDTMGKDNQLMAQLLRIVEIPTANKSKDRIQMAPIDDEAKKKLIQRIEDAEKTRNEINKED